MANKFLRCFPRGDGMMMCEHHNGSWIVFPMSYGKQGEIENRPQQEDDFQSQE